MPQVPVLSQKQLEDELASRQGLIPANIDADRGQTLWIDLERCHCYQGFFQACLDSFAGFRGSSPDCFVSSVDVLDSIRIPLNAIEPTGLIFHAGRCGSTLLAQLLARSRENMVFGEAAPHNQIWRWERKRAAPSAKSTVTTYRNLFLTMGRGRLPSYRSHIVKFTSFNILKFHQIRAAFPGVPSLFLFRDPTEVLDSYHRAKPSWMGQELAIGGALETPEIAVEAFFRAALDIRDADFRCLDYASLTPDSITSVLAFLRLNPSPRESKLMSAAFLWDAKSKGIPRRFVPRPRASALSCTAADPEILLELYTRLTTWRPLLEPGRARDPD